MNDVNSGELKEFLNLIYQMNEKQLLRFLAIYNIGTYLRKAKDKEEAKEALRGSLLDLLKKN